MAAAAGTGLQPTLAELVALGGELARQPARAQRVQAAAAGSHTTRLAGRGMDYADSRPYVAGDDARHVDWRVSARTGQMYSKRFHAERERVCLLLLDPVDAQFFGTRVRFKSVQAARAAAAAAWHAQAQGDRIGVFHAADGHATAPRAGQRGVMAALDALVCAYAAAPAAPARPLAQALPEAARLCRGGVLVVLADASRAVEVPATAWAACSAHAQVHLVVVSDALETAPPSRRLSLLGPAGRIEVDLSSAAARRQWQQQFTAPLQALQGLSAQGAQIHLLDTAAPAGSWLPGIGAVAV